METGKPIQTALLATSAMARQPALAPCLHEFACLLPWSRRHRQRHDAIVGWGYKPTADKARLLARQTQRPYIAVEDGFVRSWGTGAQGYASHSIVVDHQGIYYDATQPSDLETLIQDGDFQPGEEAHARAMMARLQALRLSKYNHAPDTPLPPGPRPRVLVVDQTRDDASITHGMASAESFEQMLESALAAHPDADILVKIHPEVIAGTKAGHLDQAAAHPRCQVIAEDINPWALFEAVDAVHVVTSQLGFEALLAGLPVTCHGMPFYAGWGLTDDHVECPRRQRRPSLSWVFAAAYLRYSRYANPYSGERSDLSATLELINDQRRHIQRGQGEWRALGFSSWKRGFIGDFLGPAADIDYQGLATDQQAEAGSMSVSRPGLRTIVWASQIQGQQLPQPLWRMEDGFLRSVGLGIDLERPLSLVLDSRGIYYDPSTPSDLEHLLLHGEFSAGLRQRARELTRQLIEHDISKYNISKHDNSKHDNSKHDNSKYSDARSLDKALDLPTDRKCLLVIGQVESDASIRTGSQDITTNAELLTAVRQRHPDACILYKPHPDVLSGVRDGGDVSPQHYDRQVTGNVTALIEQVDEVHTMTSLAGFEALLRGTPVVTYGVPFYAGWGLTRDHGPVPARRQRCLTLDELVAATLLIYPHYVDPTTGQPINAETAVALLRRQRLEGRSLKLWQRAYRLCRSTFYGRR